LGKWPRVIGERNERNISESSAKSGRGDTHKSTFQVRARVGSSGTVAWKFEEQISYNSLFSNLNISKDVLELRSCQTSFANIIETF